LNIPVTRWLLNSAFRSRGCIASIWYPRFFDGSRPHGDFLWRCKFRDKDILLPVVPTFPQSWLIAYSMHRHEPHLVRFWDTYLRLRPNPVFFDVGANYGIHTYRLLACGSKCVAFEPQQTCIRYLETVARLNGWNVDIEECVLGSAEGSALFYRSKGTFTSSTVQGWVNHWDTVIGEEVVRRNTLDAFCESAGLYPDLVKIDVEGAEASVIAGAARCLQVSKPTLVVETQQETGSRDTLWQTLVPLGYKVCDISGPRATVVDSQSEFAERIGWDFVFTSDLDLLNAIVKR
jgi:FkbM family methyltransferase